MKKRIRIDIVLTEDMEDGAPMYVTSVAGTNEAAAAREPLQAVMNTLDKLTMAPDQVQRLMVARYDEEDSTIENYEPDTEGGEETPEPLLACPFCGRPVSDALGPALTSHGSGLMVQCRWCGGMGGSSSDACEAHEYWNTRRG